MSGMIPRNRWRDRLESILIESNFNIPDGFVDSDWRPNQPNPECKIWRYLNFTQLMSIIQREKLWFSNILGFDDPYETAFPIKNEKFWDTEPRMANLPLFSPYIHDPPPETLEEERYTRTERELSDIKKILDYSYINCWNLSEHESAALWGEYTDDNQGLAIVTSVENIQNALKSKQAIVYGNVEYIDYENEGIPEGVYSPLYHKRRSFQYEQEYRLAYIDLPQIKSSDVKSNNPNNSPQPGHYVSVDIDGLISEIYISPTAEDWFMQLIKEVLSRYDIDCNIRKSDIFDSPHFES
jgi:hypothetical protein